MRMKRAIVGSVLIAVLAGCSSPQPVAIDTANPVEFKHATTIFSIQIPSQWKRIQDQVPTEALGIFTDPTGEASIVTYVGLLDRRLTDDEGRKITGELVATLLHDPANFQLVSQQRGPDGSFEIGFTFTRGERKYTGEASFHDTDLALSGVIMQGPQDGWETLKAQLQLLTKTFKFDPIVLQATYFEPIENEYYILVVPIDWQQQLVTDGAKVYARNQQMSILLVQQQLDQPLAASELADQALASLRRSFKLNGTLVGSEALADGRLKVTLQRSDRQIIGYVEQFESTFVGLFFDVPAARAADYQPFTDFVYSTYISGPPVR